MYVIGNPSDINTQIGAFMTILVSVTDTAWEYIKVLSPHKYRKPNIQFNGRTFVTITDRTTAKGFSEFLAKIIVRQPINQFDTTNYPITPTGTPAYILPSSFIDTRPSYLSEPDYEFLPPGTPLSTLPPALLYSLIYHPTETEYTHWVNLEPYNRHAMNFPRVLLKPISDIVDYWHICSLTGRLPRSPVEKLSAFLNAVGLQYLDHPLLHPTASDDNQYFSRLDRELAKMKANAARRKAK